MNSSSRRMPKGTFDSHLAKIVFGDDVQRQRGPWTDREQERAAQRLLGWLDVAEPSSLLQHAEAIDAMLVARLHGRHLRLVCQWFSENAPSVGDGMRVVARHTLAMGRAVGYNALFQPAPLARLRQVLESEGG